jgi:hypothetical protein
MARTQGSFVPDGTSWVWCSCYPGMNPWVILFRPPDWGGRTPSPPGRKKHDSSGPRTFAGGERLIPGALPPGPRHFPLFANSMAREQGSRRLSRRRRSPGWVDTPSPAIMLLAQRDKCPGVWEPNPRNLEVHRSGMNLYCALSYLSVPALRARYNFLGSMAITHNCASERVH